MNTDFIPSILDIEASGFGSSSYPIEIGVVLNNGKRLCCLIRPHSSWTHWDKKAQKLHGIAPELLLQKGREIPQVCAEFNSLLSGLTVYSDAWSHDISWLNRLYEFSGMQCAFNLSPIEAIATEEQLLCWDEVKQELLARKGDVIRHRATNDAILVQQTFLKSAELASCQSR